MKSVLLAMMALALFACSSTPGPRSPSSLPSKEDRKAPSNSTVPTTKKELWAYYVTVAKTAKAKTASNDSDRDWRSRCEDEKPMSCMKVACAQGGFNCNVGSYLEQVIKLCQGSDGRCVQEVCKQGGINCNVGSYLENVITMCKESRGSCVKAVCAQGGFNCNVGSYLEEVVKLCQDVDGSCVTDVCSQGGYNCNVGSYLEQVIGLCRNQ